MERWEDKFSQVIVQEVLIFFMLTGLMFCEMKAKRSVTYLKNLLTKLKNRIYKSMHNFR